MRSGSKRWWGLVFLSAAISLVIIDITIVNVAIPAIVTDLGTTASTTQWIQEAYTLTLAALLVVAGRLADAVGRRRALVVGLIVFTVASVIAATAPNGGVLIAARVLQGVGGAAILPCTLSLLNATFRGKERATAFAVWGSTIGAMAAVGPLLGGWLTTEFSWRWAFWINLVLAPVAVVGALVFIAESKQSTRSRGIDVAGLLLCVVASLSLVFGLIEGRTLGWWAATSPNYEIVFGLSPVPFAFAAALIGLVALIRWERLLVRRGRDPLLDLSLFTIPAFARGNAIVFTVALGQLGLLFVLPLWLQSTLGYTATQTGLILIPIAVGAFLAAATTPLLAGGWGSTWVIRFGLLTEIGGLIWFAAIATSDVSGWALVPALTLYGFGVGTADAQLPSLVLRDIPVERSGQGAGVQSTAQELGSAMGIAVIGTVLFTSLAWQLDAGLGRLGIDVGDREATTALVVDSAGTAISGLGGRERDIADDALSAATRNSALVGAGFLTVGVIATVSLRARRDEPADAVRMPLENESA